MKREVLKSFNPLTGISSILTIGLDVQRLGQEPWFQSPDGDFVYSDPCAWVWRGSQNIGFQSPDGDFVYSDRPTGPPGSWSYNVFQSPDGDFVYSDEGRIRRGQVQVMGFNPLTGISSILTAHHK